MVMFGFLWKMSKWYGGADVEIVVEWIQGMLAESTVVWND